MTLAERIINLNNYEAMDQAETPETIDNMIQTDPTAVIDYLVSIIEDLTEA